MQPLQYYRGMHMELEAQQLVYLSSHFPENSFRSVYSRVSRIFREYTGSLEMEKEAGQKHNIPRGYS